MSAARMTMVLYQHDQSDRALLLSPYGRKRDAQWIPLSLLSEPKALKASRPHGEACHKGAFEVAEWKLRELGWIDDADEKQGVML